MSIPPQVLIYTEDFKSERADRERAQGRIQDLKDEIIQLQQQLHKQVRRQPFILVDRVHPVTFGSFYQLAHLLKIAGRCNSVVTASFFFCPGSK